MTVSVTTTESPAYAGNGSTTAFSTSFAFDADSWVKVYVYTDSTGARVLKTLTTDYTLTGEGTGSAGTVTFLTAPATGETVKIFKEPDLNQEVDLVNNRNFEESVVEGALDKLTHQVQYLQSQLNRVLKLTGTSTITDLEIESPTVGKAGNALIINPDGDGYTYAAIEAGSSVTILDEDDMVSDSATAVPSQQSTKAYVDTQVAAAGGGAWEVISSNDLTESTLTLALSSSYSAFKLILINGSTATAGERFAIRAGTNVSTFNTTAADYYSRGPINASLNTRNDYSAITSGLSLNSGLTSGELLVIAGDGTDYGLHILGQLSDMGAGDVSIEQLSGMLEPNTVTTHIKIGCLDDSAKGDGATLLGISGTVILLGLSTS